MSAETRLVVDVENLQVRPRGPAIAGIWFEKDNEAFPAAGWSDFVIVILSWLANALVTTIRGNGGRVRVRFMDGPYAVDVATSAEMLRFTFVSLDKEIGGGEAEINPFVLTFTAQAGKILHACRSQRWWSADADRLDSLLGDLKRAVRTG
ncbi:MAG: hypothetical protein JO097_06115 [Acidobacteriaceae bacterium]|nr:hypothetical protein [Acidobacteriaceae bacterium]